VLGPTLGVGICLGLLSVVAAAVCWWAVKEPPRADDLMAGIRVTLVAAILLGALAWGHRRVVEAIHAMDERRGETMLHEAEELALRQELRFSANDLEERDLIGQRAGGVAPDVNNALTAALANGELIEAGERTKDVLRSFVGFLESVLGERVHVALVATPTPSP